MDAMTLNSRQKKGAPGHLFEFLSALALGELLLAVALAKLVDLLGGLQDVLLAGVERVRLAGNFKLQQRVLVSVFPLDGFPGGHGGAGQDRKIRRNVLEDDVSVFWMNVLFHGQLQLASR